ncbi:hypothetical protein AOL_s00088g16 [Orbilia oligospora ATCC 24927]|uniref:FAD-binding FR-type domain-containing protein n=2 Tax=Orbilia oligospora TaxID=2813651 RepID=G1XHQ3_ARTOA|nr:hypothetical protein AOL_s00088g16 [Orbilia oligospora ATCC 24927]EGX47301.1 hypothetical protein AOL_s00088g16 [Orbilia oligospora ATCC 24927]KAF3270562.1 hypothetical protein TWF970_010765 [Orbilia oligospora]
MEAGSVDKLANLAAVPLWYGLGLAACAVLLLLYQVSKSCIAGIKKGIVYMYGCVHLHSPLRLGIIGTTTRGRFVAWGLFVIANGVGMCLGPNNTTAWLVRSARMASMNFFLVACGGKLNYLGYVLGAPYSLAEALHKWAGYIGIVQATVHASIAIALKKPQDLWTDAGFLTVAGLVALAVLLSLKNKMYETHRFIHIALAIFIFRGFWVHSWEHLRPQYPITCISLWGSGFLLTKAMQLYRMAVGTGYAHIHVTHFQGAIQLRVETRRPSEFLPGQFFYLCMPRAHPFAFLQSHPFIIAWWDGISGEGTKTVYLLIQPRRGFTSRLLMLGHAISYRGFLEGPYGKRLRLDDYGTVIILASGIGIAGVLPYIKDLLLGFNASKAKIKRLHLIWILSAEGELG